MTEESKNILESMKQSLQDIVVPEMREIKSEIRRLDDKMDNIGKRMDSMDRHLDEAFNVRERLAVLEARVASR